MVCPISSWDFSRTTKKGENEMKKCALFFAMCVTMAYNVCAIEMPMGISLPHGTDICLVDSPTASSKDICLVDSPTASSKDVCFVSSPTASSKDVCFVSSPTASSKDVCFVSSPTASSKDVCFVRSPTASSIDIYVSGAHRLPMGKKKLIIATFYVLGLIR